MRHVGITTSIATGDNYPDYDFFVYDDCDDMICINMSKSKKKKALAPQELDQMNKEDIDEWYKYNGRSSFDD